MSVVLEIIAGPATGVRATVAAGASLRVGRNGDNDVVVADDPTMSRWHFELHCDGSECVVRDLNSRSGTFVNGRKIVAEESVKDQDELKAGQSRFRLRIDRESAAGNNAIDENAVSPDRRPSSPSETGFGSSNGFRGRIPLRNEQIETTLGRARLEPDVSRRVATGKGVEEIIATLTEAGLIADAIKLVAAAMPPRCAVRWACRCVRRDAAPSDTDASALAAAERWVAAPTEEHRREA
ncbi:MAG: FHA domain-containing protein, partial [Planctomycetaceae bacterium]